METFRNGVPALTVLMYGGSAAVITIALMKLLGLH